MRIVVSSQVTVIDPPKAWIARAESELKVVNPEYVRVVRFASIYAERPHKHILGADYIVEDRRLIVPRGWFFDNLWQGEPFDDQTIVNVNSNIDGYAPKLALLPHQKDALIALMEKINENEGRGIPSDLSCVLATSAGKTIFGLALAYQLETPALIVVPTQEIEAAWRSDAMKFLGIPKNEIGTVRASKSVVGKRLTIASLQTLIRRDPREWNTHHGLTIYDECHKLNVAKFIESARNCRSAIRVGLTATCKRKDGTMPAIQWHVGQTAYEDTTPRNSVPLTYCGVVDMSPRFMARSESLGQELSWTEFIGDLCASTTRHDAMTSLIKWIANNHRGGIVVTSCRVNHLERMAETVRKGGISVAVLTGQLGHGEERERLFEEIKAGKYKVTFATQAIVGTGASVPFWHHLVIGTPFSDGNVMEQLKGRPIRKEPNKVEAFVWDWIDNHHLAKSTGRSRYIAVKPHIKQVRWFTHTHNTLTDERCFREGVST